MTPSRDQCTDYLFTTEGYRAFREGQLAYFEERACPHPSREPPNMQRYAWWQGWYFADTELRERYDREELSDIPRGLSE